MFDKRKLVALAAWSALLTGSAELAMRGMQKLVLHRSIYLSRDIIWMTPAADLILFGLAALGLALVGLVAPRVSSLRVASSVFSFLGMFSVLALQPWLVWWAMLALSLGFGFQAGVFAVTRELLLWRIVRITLPVLVAIVSVLGIGYRALVALSERSALAALPAAPAGAPNVLLIVWDAVRARDLSLYGYERATTPRLSELASAGVMFERAISTAPYTLPTHASLFTGLWAHQQSTTWTVGLDGVPPTLAEALGALGYRTGAFSANHILVTWENGLLRGFSHASDYVPSLGELARSSALVKWFLAFDRVRGVVGWYDQPGRRDAAEISGSFLGWLDRGAATRPFFAFLNVYDAHDPYLPSAPFDTLFGWPAGAGPAERRRLGALALATQYELSAADIARQRDQYNGAIAEIDEGLGRLLGELKRRGVLENTLVVVGDHGEAFGEHRAFRHGNDVYLEEVHVPLIMALPGRVPTGVRVPGVVSLRDVPATIAEILGFAGTSWPLQGRSLSRTWRPGFSVTGDTVLAEVEKIPRGGQDFYPVRRGNVRSILAWPWQLIIVGTDVELYNLVADPAQSRDVVADSANVATRDSLAAVLRRWRLDAVPGKR